MDTKHDYNAALSKALEDNGAPRTSVVSREVYTAMRRQAGLPPEANVDHLVAKYQSGNRHERRAAWAQLRRAQKKAGK